MQLVLTKTYTILYLSRCCFLIEGCFTLLSHLRSFALSSQARWMNYSPLNVYWVILWLIVENFTHYLRFSLSLYLLMYLLAEICNELPFENFPPLKKLVSLKDVHTRLYLITIILYFVLEFLIVSNKYLLMVFFYIFFSFQVSSPQWYNCIS